MKEIKTILENLEVGSQQGIKTALASVVNVYGSSYRRTGVRMLVREDRLWFGAR